MTESWVWELVNQTQNRIPDPVDYLEMRRATFGSDLTMSLCRIGHGRRSRRRSTARPLRSLENAAADYACLMNDVFSYQKEIEYEGESTTAILVVQNFFGCDYPTALGVIHDLMTRACSSSSTSPPTNSPSCTTTSSSRTEARGVMDGYVEELENWMAGILNWHQQVPRYREFQTTWKAGPTASCRTADRH